MANYKFTNTKQIEKYLEKQIIKALTEVADVVRQRLYDTVKNRLYDAWTPSQYKRTMELLKCISHTKVKKVYGSYVVNIYYDTKKIHPYVSDDARWNKHADFWGEDVSEYIPLWIEYGTDNQYFSHDGILAVEDTLEWISREYNRLFKEALLYKGIPLD